MKEDAFSPEGALIRDDYDLKMRQGAYQDAEVVSSVQRKIMRTSSGKRQVTKGRLSVGQTAEDSEVGIVAEGVVAGVGYNGIRYRYL